MGKTTFGFEVSTNLAGFSSNPTPYPLTANEAFQAGDLVVVTSGKITKATTATTVDVVGVMAETVTGNAGGTNTGRVHDNPLNVLAISYTGTDPVLGDNALALGSSRTIDPASATSGPLAVREVDSTNKIAYVVVKKHLFHS